MLFPRRKYIKILQANTKISIVHCNDFALEHLRLAKSRMAIKGLTSFLSLSAIKSQNTMQCDMPWQIIVFLPLHWVCLVIISSIYVIFHNWLHFRELTCFDQWWINVYKGETKDSNAWSKKQTSFIFKFHFILPSNLMLTRFYPLSVSLFIALPLLLTYH